MGAAGLLSLGKQLLHKFTALAGSKSLRKKGRGERSLMCVP
jgi:hypothetical protein